MVGKTSESKDRPTPALHGGHGADLQPRPRHHPDHAVSISLWIHHARRVLQSERGEVGGEAAFALRDYGVTSPPICALARLWTLVARLSTHCGGHYRGQALIVDIQGS